jgi:hypothetical protein
MGNVILNEEQISRKASEVCFKADGIHRSVQQSHLSAGIQTGILAVCQATVHDTTIQRVTWLLQKQPECKHSNSTDVRNRFNLRHHKAAKNGKKPAEGNNGCSNWCALLVNTQRSVTECRRQSVLKSLDGRLPYYSTTTDPFPQQHRK